MYTILSLNDLAIMHALVTMWRVKGHGNNVLLCFQDQLRVLKNRVD